jgi:hypothetical protein
LLETAGSTEVKLVRCTDVYDSARMYEQFAGSVGMVVVSCCASCRTVSNWWYISHTESQIKPSHYRHVVILYLPRITLTKLYIAQIPITVSHFGTSLLSDARVFAA